MYQESSSGAPQFVPVYDDLPHAIMAVFMSCSQPDVDRRNCWEEPSVKTMICELQIHHRVRRIQTTVIFLFNLRFMHHQKMHDGNEDLHRRYVRMRDAVAS